MPLRRGTRTALCLLLAASTAIAAVAPARACGCTTLSPQSSPPTTAPAPKSCCEASPRKRCGCAPAGTAKNSCCDTKSRPEKPAPAGPPRAGCDCAAPGVPPAPAPAPVFADAEQALGVAVVPPVLIPGPPTAAPVPHASPPLHHTDLVISLSRLTC